MINNSRNIVFFYNNCALNSDAKYRLFSEYFYNKFLTRSGLILNFLKYITLFTRNKQHTLFLLLFVKNFIVSYFEKNLFKDKKKLLLTLMKNSFCTRSKTNLQINQSIKAIFKNKFNFKIFSDIALENILSAFRKKIFYKIKREKLCNILNLTLILICDFSFKNNVSIFLEKSKNEIKKIVFFIFENICNINKNDSNFENVYGFLLCLKIFEQIENFYFKYFNFLELDKRCCIVLSILFSSFSSIFLIKKAKIYLLSGIYYHLISLFKKFSEKSKHFILPFFEHFKKIHLSAGKKIYLLEIFSFFHFFLKTKNINIIKFKHNPNDFLESFFFIVFTLIISKERMPSSIKIFSFLGKLNFQIKILFLLKIFKNFTKTELKNILKFVVSNKTKFLLKNNYFTNKYHIFLGILLGITGNQIIGVSVTFYPNLLLSLLDDAEKNCSKKLKKKGFTIKIDFLTLFRNQLPVRIFVRFISHLIVNLDFFDKANSHIFSALERFLCQKGNEKGCILMYNPNKLILQKLNQFIIKFFKKYKPSKKSSENLNKFFLKIFSNFYFFRNNTIEIFYFLTKEILNLLLLETRENSKLFLNEILFLFLQNASDKNYNIFQEIYFFGNLCIIKEDIENLPFVICIFSKMLNIETDTSSFKFFTKIAYCFLNPHILSSKCLVRPILHYLGRFFIKTNLFLNKKHMAYFLTVLETVFKKYSEFEKIFVCFKYIFSHFPLKKSLILHFIETFCTIEKDTIDNNYYNFLLGIILTILEEKNIKAKLNVIKMNFLDLLLSLLEKKIKPLYKERGNSFFTEYFLLINNNGGDHNPLSPFKKIICTLFRKAIYQKSFFQKSPHFAIDFISNQVRFDKIKNFKSNGIINQECFSLNFESIRFIKNILSKL